MPIPLREEDESPVLDFQGLLDLVYGRSGYEFSVDYGQPPKPSWDKAELAWMEELLGQGL